VTPSNLALFTNNYASFMDFSNYLSSAVSAAFQTQNGRDTVRQTIGGFLSGPVGINSRFPETGFYVYLNHPTIMPLYDALMSSLDTRNRVIEVNEPSNPTTSETLNATKRTDDASVASRSNLSRLKEVIDSGVGVFDRALFESSNGLTWATSSSSS